MLRTCYNVIGTWSSAPETLRSRDDEVRVGQRMEESKSKSNFAMRVSNYTVDRNGIVGDRVRQSAAKDRRSFEFDSVLNLPRLILKCRVGCF